MRRRDVLKLAASGPASLLMSRDAGAVGADYDVVIVGAGIAGMTAARLLSQTGPGLKVLVLEARGRVGGRLMTLQDGSPHLPGRGVELGASSIFGSEAATWDLVNEFNLPTRPLDGKAAGTTAAPATSDSPESERKALSARLMAAWKRGTGLDMPYAAFLDTLDLSPSDRDAARRLALQRGVAPESVSAEALVKTAARWDAWHDQDFEILGGYSALATQLAKQIEGRIQLNSVVDEIFWRPGLVGVSYKLNGSSTALTCRQLVLTAPLGVLQSGAIKLDPALPPDMQSAMQRLAMTKEAVVPMVFSEAVAEDNGGLHADAGRQFSVFDTPAGGSTGVAGHFAGAAAETLAGLGAEAAIARIVRWLEEDSGRTGLMQKLTWHRIKDWSRDPFSLGGRSFARPGGADGRSRLATPVDNTLYLAGEATAAIPHHATVHGALMSGRRVADQVASTLNVGGQSPDSDEEPLFQLL